MSVTSIKELIDLLQKSELLEKVELEQARAAVRSGDDPATAAKRWVDAGLISEWQGAQLVAGRSSFYLGKYRLIRLLGRGGMGGVFLAEHTTMDRRVALKTISREFGNTPGALEQFLLEARTIAALDHPNICQAYSLDQEGGRFFLVMEFIEGKELKEVVEEQGPLESSLAADYVRQAAEGLQHGHDRKIVHSDIKPSNLLLNEKGVIKIVDMGMSRLQDPGKATKDSGEQQLPGSVDYLAPEQAMGAKDFDHRADIYSLGCTLYFLLTGRPPFLEGMLHEKLMKHQAMTPESIAELRPEVPQGLVDICEKMMAKKPDDRYQAAEEVRKALVEAAPTKRRAKAAAPLKRARPLKEPASQTPLIDVDTAAVSLSGVRPKMGAAKFGNEPPRHKSLTAHKQKIIAGSIAGVLLLVLLAVLLPFMLTPKPEEPRPEDPWLEASSQSTSTIVGTSEDPNAGDGMASPSHPPSRREPGFGVPIGYSHTVFTEATTNDGSIANSLTVTLGDDTFTADAVSGGHVTASNVPAGLTATFVRDSDTQITMTLTGNAESHGDADGVDDLTVTFADGAFTGGNASAMTGSTRSDLDIAFFTETMLAWWKLDETSGTTAADSTGNGHDGTVAAGSWVTGKIGGGLAFNGTNSAIRSPLNPPETDAAVSLWIKPQNGNCGIFEVVGNKGVDRMIHLNAGNVVARIWDDETISSTGLNLADGQWHHVVHTYGTAAGGQKLYVDGKEVASGSKSVSDFDWETGVNIGYSGSAGSKHFSGEIDDVRFYRQVLTAREVADIYGAAPESAIAEDSALASSAGDASAVVEEAKSDPQVDSFTSDPCVIPVTPDNARSVTAGAHGTQGLDGLLNDPFSYDLSNPTSPRPVQTWGGARGYHHQDAKDAELAFTLDDSYENLFVDAYGRIGYASRDNNMTIEFYDGSWDAADLTERISGFSIMDSDPWHSRATAKPRTQADRMLIIGPHSGFTLMELRVGGVPAAKMFLKLAETGDLPRIEKGVVPRDPHTLGELILTPGQTVDLKLIGGEQAIRSPWKFAMRRDDAKGYWVVYLQDENSADTTGQTPVAAIKLEEGKIRFGWWPKGTPPERANHLLNCGLEITIDERRHFLPLGRIRQVSPVVVSPDKGIGTFPLPKDGRPKAESLQLQIVRFEGFPEEQQFSAPTDLFKSAKGSRKHKPLDAGAGFEVAEEMDSSPNAGKILSPGKFTKVTFPKSALPDYWLEVAFKPQSVDVAAKIVYPPQTTPVLLRANEARQYLFRLTTTAAQLTNRLQPLRGGARKPIEDQLKPIQALKPKFENLGALYGTFTGEPPKMHFRLYMVVDENHRVPILQSLPPTTAE